jgi:hypothetical protein
MVMIIIIILKKFTEFSKKLGRVASGSGGGGWGLNVVSGIAYSNQN